MTGGFSVRSRCFLLAGCVALLPSFAAAAVITNPLINGDFSIGTTGYIIEDCASSNSCTPDDPGNSPTTSGIVDNAGNPALLLSGGASGLGSTTSRLFTQARQTVSITEHSRFFSFDSGILSTAVDSDVSPDPRFPDALLLSLRYDDVSENVFVLNGNGAFDLGQNRTNAYEDSVEDIDDGALDHRYMIDLLPLVGMEVEIALVAFSEPDGFITTFAADNLTLTGPDKVVIPLPPALLLGLIGPAALLLAARRRA